MASEAYLKLLRDPRWQKKRLKILERDEWACIACAATDRNLQVHHRRYVWGKKPWEYDDGELETLCDVCHANATSADKSLKAALAHIDTSDLEFLAGIAIGMRIRGAWCLGDDGIGTLEMAAGIGAVVGVHGDVIVSLIPAGGQLDLLAVAAKMKTRPFTRLSRS